MAAKHWTPEPGQLVIRCLVGTNVNEAALEYREDPKDGTSMKRLLRMRDFSTSAEMCPWTEMCTLTVESMGDGNIVVVRKLPTDNELQGFVRTWSDPRLSIRAWLALVLKEGALLESEKERLKRAVQAVENDRADQMEPKA